MKLKILVSLLFILVSSHQSKLFSQKNNSGILTHELIKLETDKIFDKIVKVRRDLHKNPELAGNEKLTQEFIKQYLLGLGLEVKTDIYGYGIVGILKGGKKGKHIAWRADMDALPNDFPDNVDFKSKVKDVQHGCGHDIHMAIGLGIAEVLSKNKQDLKGTVYFIFQPEEETFKGGKGMVEGGLFSIIKPTEIYGLHITPGPVGQIMVKSNEMYAYQKGVRIQFKNKVTKENLTELYAKIVSSMTRSINNSNPWELQQILDPKDGLASPSTIYTNYFMVDPNFGHYTKDDTIILEADMYETDKDKLKDIIPGIKKVIESQGLSDQLISVSFFKENSTIQNDPKLTNIAINTLDKTFGKGTVTLDYGQIPYSNDDFSYFQEKIPGVYFFLGGSNFEKGMIAMIHAPNFMVDEECIRVGVKSFSSLIFERLKK
ncbi:M20/M25/M40 family metallo-hydrolase [Flavobacterium sp.]|uniref:M20 metallopeptidase family protein n=1 Tax=Flavobacterium sp. TaxID=239 RepID=UPI00286DCD1F|nr:M20/M25/M40 family metallo-hydrolase [Flavobacterium sp.]